MHDNDKPSPLPRLWLCAQRGSGSVSGQVSGGLPGTTTLTRTPARRTAAIALYARTICCRRLWLGIGGQLWLAARPAPASPFQERSYRPPYEPVNLAGCQDVCFLAHFIGETDEPKLEPARGALV